MPTLKKYTMHAKANQTRQYKSSSSAELHTESSPEAGTQSDLQEAANQSPQVQTATQLQRVADKHSGKQRPIQQKKNNTGLPEKLKTGVEHLSGYAMDDVKVHYNSSKPAQLNAHAYAQGTEIHLASGQEKHLPHEAWHVVQQKQGRVRPTKQMKRKVEINDDVKLEKEADVMGAKALSFNFRSNSQKKTSQFKTKTVQLYTASNGDKVSQNQLLLVINPLEAYASPEKFATANTLNGQVQFIQGKDAPAPYAHLKKIIPVATENSTLAVDTSDYNIADQKDGIKEQAEQNYYPTEEAITFDIMDAMVAYYDTPEKENELMAFFGTTDYEAIEPIIGQLAETIVSLLPAFGNYNESGVNTSIDQYMENQVINNDRALMPSDCGALANIITGNDNATETPEIVAGNTYMKTQNLENRENAEWDHHFAAIIMVDGNDHITMENAGAKKSEKFNKAQFDKTWTFQMYGPEEGQSFANKYDQDLGY